MKYTDKDISMLKKNYDESQIAKKSENFNLSKTTKELESRISDLESSLNEALTELDYLKTARKDVLTKEEVANLMRMIPPTTQRSVNIPVPIDQGGTGVTTLAEAQALIGALTTVDLTADVTGALPIANGGTGQTGAQAAIDALTAVSSATNEHVLTKDTATGNAIFKAASGGFWTDSGTTLSLTTSTDDVVIGNTTPVSSAKVSVDGDADQRQLVVQGHSTQTDNLFEVQKSDGTVLFGVSNASGITVGSTGSGITLSENTSIALDPAGSADGKYSGITVTGTGGATIAFGDLVTLDKDDSRWELVDVSVAAAATGDARGLLGMAVTSSTDGGALTILLHGIIRADANFPALTIGAPVYASTTGDVTVTQPTTTDHVIRIVGYAMTADELYFNPGNSWTTHT